MKKIILTTVWLLVFALTSSLEANTHWNQFRGPNDGVASNATLPVNFSDTKNVQWRTPIHDLGWSSPVIWKKQVWVTTAKKDGTELFAVCVNLETGEIKCTNGTLKTRSRKFLPPQNRKMAIEIQK